MDYRLVATPPSLLAAASIWLARKLLGRGAWDANLRHYSGYGQPEILPIAQTMLDYVLRSGCKNLGMGLDPNFVVQASYEGGNEHSNLFKKYATRKVSACSHFSINCFVDVPHKPSCFLVQFFRVSEIVRDWAVDRYTFETPTGYEWDKLEEWTSKSIKKLATASSGSQRPSRLAQEFYDDDDEDEMDDDIDEQLENELEISESDDEDY